LVVVAWMMLIGLVITAPLALAAGSQDRTPASAWAWRRSRRGRPPVGRGPRHRDRLGAVLAVAALSLLGAYLVFGERLGRLQLGGVAVVIVAVAVLSGFARDVYL
jgi:drug/metabolite transporter (DMT)-like permease